MTLTPFSNGLKTKNWRKH